MRLSVRDLGGNPLSSSRRLAVNRRPRLGNSSGQIRAIRPDTREVPIKHDDIKSACDDVGRGRICTTFERRSSAPMGRSLAFTTAVNGRPRGYSMISRPPSRADFTSREWRLIQRLNTPFKVQRWLNDLPYNAETHGGTQRSFRSVVRKGTAHCMEAAMFAAVVLEQHGYSPIVMSIESKDWLDHVVFLYKHRGRWGSVARSRDPGLHGRKAVFRSPRDVALSYIEGYVDYTGRVRGYGVCNLAAALPTYDWRFSLENIWKVEQLLIDWPHKTIKTSDRKYRALLKRYTAYRKAHGKKPWRYYRGRERWTPLPAEFL